MPGSDQLPAYAVTAVIVVALLAFRMRRLQKLRPLRLERLWVVPAIFLALSALILFAHPPEGADWGWLVLALLVGGGLGWVRGRLMHITVDPETRGLNIRSSPAALLFLVALYFLRFGARTYMATQNSGLHVDVGLVTDASILLATGVFGVSCLEMWLRGRRILAGY